MILKLIFLTLAILATIMFIKHIKKQIQKKEEKLLRNIENSNKILKKYNAYVYNTIKFFVPEEIRTEIFENLAEDIMKYQQEK